MSTSTRLALLLTLLTAFFSTLISAQSSTTALLGPSQAATNAAPGAGIDGYTYIGCWNETTGYIGSNGQRALADGTMEANNTATTFTCLKFCHQSSYQYCGMEYGRECWGSPYLSALSTQLNSSRCDYACEGNASEVCGGSLAITLFNLTDASAAQSGGAKSVVVTTGRDGVWGLVALGFMSLVFVMGL